jgi:Zn-dependent protease with chaperone function
MNVAACLVLYSVGVQTVAPPLLRSLTDSGHAPRLGVTAWLTAIASVLLTWVAAAGYLVADLVHRCERHSGIVLTCVARLHDAAVGHGGMARQILLLSAVFSVGAALAIVALRVAMSTRRLRARARAHADAIRLVGGGIGIDDVVVVSADTPAAYCVSGNPPTIVVTSAAISVLDDSQLAAVVAHERAHLSGHHSAIVTVLRSLAAVLPWIGLIHQAAHHVPRLLEMCADDTVTRAHDRRDLLSGLVALCGAGPTEALAAAGVAVLARAERLAAVPTHRATRRKSAALSTTIAILVAGPWVTAISACTVALLCDM